MDKFLNPEEFNIDNIFRGKYQIPIYQRPYSWGKEEVVQLLKDISAAYDLYKNSNMESSQVNNEEMLIFAGTLFIKTEKNVKNTYTEYDIVDGQQRITTITLILMVLLNHFYMIESKDDVVLEIENYLWKKVDRKRDKTSRILTLGNIDQEIMIELFDKLFAKNDIIEFANAKLNSEINDVEQNLLNNFLEIDLYFNNFSNENEYYDYFEYIKYNVRFIAIEVHTNLVKLFSIFESINSKGKPLEEIDLIKSYIFQNISEDDYDEYLHKWGKLIIKTNDNLMDYLIIYVRANISYYRNSIKLNNFKTLVENGFMQYYNSDNVQDTMLHFIDDMLDNVKYYNMLSDTTLLEKEGLSKRSLVYFMMNNVMEYIHTKALYFKLLCLREKNNLSKETFEKLIEQAFRFILTYQSICSRESKQTLGVFVDVQNEIYNDISHYDDKVDLSQKDFKSIVYILNKRISENAINDETIRNSIKNSITYRRNKKVVKVLLSFLEYMDDAGRVDYNKLYWILKLGKDIHIDHILPLSPAEHDDNFKYYILDNSIVLKEGQDFMLNGDSNVIGKEEFYDEFLHVLGNLRLEWANDNIKKSNKLIYLKEFDERFNTSSQVSKRTSSLIKQIVESELLMMIDNIGDISSYAKSDNLHSIDEFISDFEYKDYTPVFFEFLGEKYILEKYNYTQLLSKVLDVFYDLEKEKFVELAQEKYRPMTSDRTYISVDKREIREPHTLVKGVYVEMNLSSNYIIKFIYILVKEMGLNTNDIKIFLKEK